MSESLRALIIRTAVGCTFCLMAVAASCTVAFRHPDMTSMRRWIEYPGEMSVQLGLALVCVATLWWPKGLTRWWRTRHDIQICGADIVLSSAERGVYRIDLNGSGYEVRARWFDNRTTITWRLRRKLRQAGWTS